MSLIKKTRQFIKDKLHSISQPGIGWDNRPYDFYLIFGQNQDNKFPWIRSIWESDFEPYFNSLIKQADTFGETGIRAKKYKTEKKVTPQDNKEFICHSEMKPGRLKWDFNSHEKWTIIDNADHYFLNFELWTPVWTVCEKRGSPPDIFISIFNERDFENKRAIQFGYFIVVATAKNLQIDSTPIIRELSGKVNAKITVLKTRKWGKPEDSGSWTFLNWIQDTSSNGIYRGQSLHSFQFNELEFEPVWEVIYRQT